MSLRKIVSLGNVAIIAAGLIAVASGANTALAADAAADEAAIRAINPAWFKAYNAGDAAAVAALYSDDAVLAAPGGPAVRGRAAIREAFTKEIAASSTAGLAFNAGKSPEFGVSGDLGWESNTFAVTDKSGATVDAGKYVTVYGKKGGKWFIIRDIWNSDAPPAPAVAAPGGEPAK